MGTRSLTHIKGDTWDADTAPATILTTYRQYDGYPTGHGADLKKFLDGFTVVNGLGMDTPAKVANGMGCLAAQFVAAFKEGPGGFYVYPPDAEDCGEEFVYTVYQPGTRDAAAEVHVRVYAVYRKRVLYDGPVSGFDPDAAQAVWERD